MCFSNNVIEQMAYEMSKKIFEDSIYPILKVDFIGEQSIGLPPFNLETDKEIPLITRLFLEGENGTIYSIEPNPNGLRFAKGEISYKQYNRLQKGEIFRGITYVSISIITFLLVGWTMVKYFI